MQKSAIGHCKRFPVSYTHLDVYKRQSRNTTQEKLHEELVQDIMNTYKLEYGLNQIGDKENITVDKAEVDTLLDGIKEPEERKKAEQNAHVYTMMLRKQKIIDFLSGL